MTMCLYTQLLSDYYGAYTHFGGFLKNKAMNVELKFRARNDLRIRNGHKHQISTVRHKKADYSNKTGT